MHGFGPEPGTRTGLSWLYVRRLKRPLALALGAAGAAQAAEHARTAPRTDRLRVHVHHSGRVFCRLRRRGRSGPPYFTGQLRDTGHGPELTGTLHESRETCFVTIVFTALTVLMAAVAVLCALSNPVVVPGLVICGVATVAFAAITVLLRLQRPTVFRIEADTLTRAIAHRFAAR